MARRGFCVACGRYGELEANHVAGVANHPTLTMNVCKGSDDCHFWLTRWQYAHGIPLNEDPERTDDVKRAALNAGTMHFFALLAHREGHGEYGNDLLMVIGELLGDLHRSTSAGVPGAFAKKLSTAPDDAKPKERNPDAEPAHTAGIFPLLAYYANEYRDVEHLKTAYSEEELWSVLDLGDEWITLTSTEPERLHDAWVWFRDTLGKQSVITEIEHQAHAQVHEFTDALTEFYDTIQVDPSRAYDAEFTERLSDALLAMMVTSKFVLRLLVQMAEEYERWTAQSS